MGCPPPIGVMVASAPGVENITETTELSKDPSEETAPAPAWPGSPPGRIEFGFVFVSNVVTPGIGRPPTAVATGGASVVGSPPLSTVLACPGASIDDIKELK